MNLFSKIESRLSKSTFRFLYQCLRKRRRSRRVTAFAEAMKLYVGTITSSSCLAPTASKDKWRAVVPEETAQAYLYPVFFLASLQKNLHILRLTRRN